MSRRRRAAAEALRRLPPGFSARGLRLLPRVQSLGTPFAQLERRNRPSVSLFTGYRPLGKDRWRLYWWPTRALLTLQERGRLTPEADAFARELEQSRTLPASVADYADALERLARERPDALERLGRTDPRLRRELLAAPVAPEWLEAGARIYRLAAAAVLAALRELGLDPARARLLDAGCGRGYLAFAFAGAGVGEVHGVDLDLLADVSTAEIDAMRELLADGRPTELAEGNLARLAYPDESLDVVFSSTVVEHLVELPLVFRETHRILVPGGLAYHGIDPWFGPAGGHSLCTLDFAWGHVRLDDEEFADYVRTYRPHEAEDAIRAHARYFQQPRLTLAETAEVARAAGFEVLAAERMPLPMGDIHRRLFSRGLLRDCRRVHPAATAHDLLSLTTKLVLRRR